MVVVHHRNHPARLHTPSQQPADRRQFRMPARLMNGF